MNKKKSIVVLCIVSIFIILMTVFAVVDFPIANTVYDYTGYVKTIKLGLDMSGGVSAVFNVENDNYGDLDTRISGTVSSLQSLLVSKGYTEATVTKGTNSNGGNTIRVEIPDVDDPEKVLELIGRPQSLYFTLEDLGDEAAESELYEKAFIRGREDLESAYVTTSDSSTSYAIGLKFNESGTKKFSDTTTNNVGKYTYIYVGGRKIMSPKINSAITNGQAIITGDYDYQSAYDFATQLQSGTFGVTLQIAEVRNISATLGENSIRIALIAGAIGVALILVLHLHRALALVLRSVAVGTTHAPRYRGYLALNRYGSRRQRHYLRESEGRIQALFKAHRHLHQERFQTLCGCNHRRSSYYAHRRNRALDTRLFLNRRFCSDVVYRYRALALCIVGMHETYPQSVYPAQQHQRKVLRT